MRIAKREKPIFGVLSEVTLLASLCGALRTVECEWAQIVGGPLSRRSSPVSYENGILQVVVDSQAALQDMNFRKMSIARAASKASMLRIDDIKLKIGSLSAAGMPGARALYGTRGRSSAASRARPGRSRSIDDSVTEELIAEITAEHPDMMPELARVIARCRAMSSAQAP